MMAIIGGGKIFFSSIILIYYFSTFFTSLNAQSVWPQPQEIKINPKQYWIVDTENFALQTNVNCELIHSSFERYRTQRFFVHDCSQLKGAGLGKYSRRPSNLTSIHGRYRPRGRKTNSNIRRRLRRYPRQLFVPYGRQGKILSTIQVRYTGNPSQCQRFPSLDMDESYYIEVNNHKAEMIVASVWGAIRGFDTLSQLLIYDARTGQYRLPEVIVNDWPRFTHRGVMIDTSRHYQPLHVIFEMLDAMEMNKMNVLHWHMVDDQSFPYMSSRFPNLALKGAYQPYTHVYDAPAISKVVEYARQRGIRVVPEFDTPGHTKSWGLGGPTGLLTACYDTRSGRPTGQYGPIDPTREKNFQFLQELFQEVTDLFPDKYFHLGGDEVSISGVECWKTNPAVRKYIRDHGMGNNYRQLEVIYMQRMMQLVRDQLQRGRIVWQEVFDNVKLHPFPDTIIHVWIEHRNGGWRRKMSDVTRSEYRVILSAPWYLDQVSEGENWIRYYETDPLDFDGTTEQKKRVLGGEACLWSEMIDGTNLIQKTWPRASAVAERLWSSAGTRYSEAVRGRFHAQHCRMQRYGLRPGPSDGPGFCPCDHLL